LITTLAKESLIAACDTEFEINLGPHRRLSMVHPAMFYGFALFTQRAALRSVLQKRCPRSAAQGALEK
jgi:hypothetical protein